MAEVNGTQVEEVSASMAVDSQEAKETEHGDVSMKPVSEGKEEVKDPNETEAGEKETLKKKLNFQRRQNFKARHRGRINEKYFHMSEDDKIMLEFYKTRLSVLKGENEVLHSRLGALVKENMRYLQMRAPPAGAV